MSDYNVLPDNFDDVELPQGDLPLPQPAPPYHLGNHHARGGDGGRGGRGIYRSRRHRNRMRGFGAGNGALSILRMISEAEQDRARTGRIEAQANHRGMRGGRHVHIRAEPLEPIAEHPRNRRRRGNSASADSRDTTRTIEGERGRTPKRSCGDGEGGPGTDGRALGRHERCGTGRHPSADAVYLYRREDRGGDEPTYRPYFSSYAGRVGSAFPGGEQRWTGAGDEIGRLSNRNDQYIERHGRTIERGGGTRAHQCLNRGSGADGGRGNGVVGLDGQSVQGHSGVVGVLPGVPNPCISQPGTALAHSAGTGGPSASNGVRCDSRDGGATSLVSPGPSETGLSIQFQELGLSLPASFGNPDTEMSDQGGIELQQALVAQGVQPGTVGKEGEPGVQPVELTVEGGGVKGGN
ncbi:hypothetical protein FRC07_010004 [Ceratobasidium sp. 392]|nr:hypothetical protein FRC07_010004 [Ceratobasidium sp. 392]